MPVFRKFGESKRSASLPHARRSLFSFRKPAKRDLPFTLPDPFVMLGIVLVGSLLFLMLSAFVFTPRSASGHFMSGSMHGGKATYIAMDARGALLRSTEAKVHWSIMSNRRTNIGTICISGSNQQQCMTKMGHDVALKPLGLPGQQWLVDYSKGTVKSIDDKSGKPSGECLSSFWGQMNHGAQLMMHDCEAPSKAVPDAQKFKFEPSYYLQHSH